MWHFSRQERLGSAQGKDMVMEGKRLSVPYIGVTGFRTRREVQTVLEVVPHGAKRRLMVGVLASSKTLQGGQGKYPGRTPRVEEIADIFNDDPRALNLIHYNTGDRQGLPEQLARLIELGGPNLHGFQLNIAWPDPTQLERLRSHTVVQQVGHRAFEEVGNDPRQLAEKLDAYRGLITHVLVDPSGGTGQEYHLPTTQACVLAIMDRHGDWLKIGIAGGLSAVGLYERITPVIGLYDHLSIDAEGRLRTPTPEDVLNLAATCAYTRRSYETFALVGQ